MRINIDDSKFYTDETLGKQKKEWRQINNEIYLFKKASKSNGLPSYNDVSECVASDVGNLLGIEMAEYHLCEKNGQHGIISKNFLDNGVLTNPFKPKRYELIDGVSLIYNIYPNFKNMELINKEDYQRYTVDLVLRAVEKYGLIKDALEMIVFDALIANYDRNPANWAIINDTENKTYKFSPLYDSCTSLGITMVAKRIDKCINPDTLEIDEEHLNIVIHEHITNKISLERSLQYKEKKIWDIKEMERIKNLIEEEKEGLQEALENKRINQKTFNNQINKIAKSYNKYDVTTVQYQPLIEYLTTFYPDEIKDIINKIEEMVNEENINIILGKYHEELPKQRIMMAKNLLLKRSEWIVNYYKENVKERGQR